MKGLYHTGATELKNIFYTPLIAVVDAEIALAERIKGFIMKYGFNEGKVKTVSFTYILNGDKKELKVPVLTLLNLPLLSIKDAHFNMEVKMLSVIERSQSKPPPLKPEEAIDYTIEKTKIKGYLTPNQQRLSIDKGLEANMKVKLHMGEAPVPGGLIKLLALMNNNLIKEETIIEKQHAYK